jgi:hypothetical protein
MWEQLKQRSLTAAHIAGDALLAVWSWVRPPLVFLLNVLAALIVIFEEWGWRPLSAFLARLARFPLWAKSEELITRLPPYGALFILSVPSVVLIPAKLIGVYMFATGHFFVAIAVIFMAKIASTALIARIFMLTQPQLMQIGWFVRAYNLFMPWHDAWVNWVRSSWVWRYGRVMKRRAEISTRDAWARARPRLRAAWAALIPGAQAAWLGTRQFVRHALGRPPLQPPEQRLLPPPDHRL